MSFAKRHNLDISGVELDMIQIELVDKEGNIVGLEEKFEVHKIPVPLHRAVSVVIFDGKKKKMLLQKRASTKPTWPGFWSNTCCTHPLPGEEYKTAAERRLREEMGFSVPLKEIFRFTYSAKYDRTWGENEYDVVFRGEYSGKVEINPEEADDYKWISITQLKRDIESNSGKYTPWFKIILKKLRV